LAYTINDISRVLGHKAEVKNAPELAHLIIDSRKLHFPETSVFFAIKGEQHDGHTYIDSLYKKGVRHFVVSADVDHSMYPGALFIKVENTLDALQQLAAFHRSQFHYPVIGITGSNGKTITKEWLFQLLNREFNIVRSPKSYNSQVGVPLSVWQMDENHQLGIFEAGISLPGEMAKLQKIIKPNIGIFTFLGDAHAEGFESIQQKISEKLSLFAHSDILFYCSDEKELQAGVAQFKSNVNPALQLFSWSKKQDATLRIIDLQLQLDGTAITCKYERETYCFVIPFTDEASVHNAITCIAVMFYMAIPFAQMTEALLHLRPVEMRLELKQGINRCSIINDSYSADINSLSIALDFLEQQPQNTKRTVILSDFLQSGQKDEALYQQIAAMCMQKNISRFIGIGPQIQRHAACFEGIENVLFFHSTSAFIDKIPSLAFADESILLKGARVFRFENISRALEQKMHLTLMEIDLNALRHNIKAYRKLMGKGVKLMCMVKAFSYGSGSYEIASVLQHAGVDYLGVAYADEGVELRKAGIRLPIMVMNTEESGFENIIKYHLEPELYSLNILTAFKHYLEQMNLTGFPVHIKIDTGMHRLGFEADQMQPLCEMLQQSTCFTIKSVFSHLAAGGDAAHDAFTNRQYSLLQAASEQIETSLGYSFIRHIANTSAIHRHPHMQLHMVRLGIGMYGIDSDPRMQQQLRNVTTLKTTISQIKHIKKGETVGYGRSDVAAQDTTIATVRIGYADGYPRLMSNGVGHMMVNGHPAKVIGRVCMDMTMLNITGIAAEEEDEVIVFGESLSVTHLARWAQTIEYEILTNISQRVRRVYFEE
jgi:alanine racemase